MRLTPGNPMTKVLVATLAFEAIVFGLAIAGMVVVAGIPVLTASLTGGGAAVLALVAAAVMRRPAGYPLGWATQVAGIALGFLVPEMFLMGAVFAALWTTSFVLGKRLDAR